MRFIVLLFSLVLAAELEVEGDLKVTGNIDASNQRIKNVAPPTQTTDAVNAEYLNSVMTDDGVYEYMYYNVYFDTYNAGTFEIFYRTVNGTANDFLFNWEEKINQLYSEGWKINNVLTTNQNSYTINSVYELKRKLED